MDVKLILVALKTLADFPFDQKPHRIIALTRDCILNYIDDEYIGNEAIRTCAKILPILAGNVSRAQSHIVQMIFDILKRLVIYTIADSTPQVRLDVLAFLDSRLDRYLIQAEILQSLFVALNDEVFQVRNEAIRLLGRLSTHNPAIVLPSLRKTLLHLLSELQQFSGDTNDLQESSQLLGQLIQSAPQLIKPYVVPILNVLVPKLENPEYWNNASSRSSSVASFVLETLGKLSTICGDDIIGYLDGLIPLIIDTLQEKNPNAKRIVALKTLSQLISSTGYVIQPCMKYPTLLPTILDVLKEEQSTCPLRIELLRVLGTIGALDPLKYKHIQSMSQKDKGGRPEEKKKTSGGKKDFAHSPQARNKKEEEDEYDTESLYPNPNIPPEDYYPTVVIATLMKILKDPGLSQHHSMVIKAVMFIFRSLGIKCTRFLPQVIPTFLKEMRRCEDGLLNAFFQHMCTVVSLVKQHIRNYLKEVFAVIFEYWNHHSLLLQILALIEEIVCALREEFKAYLPDLIPKLLRVISTDKSESREPTLRVLHSIRIFAEQGVLDSKLYTILPSLVRCSERSDFPIAVRRDAIKTIARIASVHNISEHASRIIHPFARILGSSNADDVHGEILKVVCLLLKQMGFNYIVFAPMINQALLQRIKHFQEFPDFKQYRKLYGRLHHKLETENNKYKEKLERTGRIGSDEKSDATHANSAGKLMEPGNSYGYASASGVSSSGPDASGIGAGTSSGGGGSGSSQFDMVERDLFDLDLRSGYTLLAYNQGIPLNLDGIEDIKDYSFAEDRKFEKEQKAEVGPTSKKPHVNQMNLMKSWAATYRSTKDDWNVWMRGFSIELLKESPSSGLRACSPLAHKYPPLARELFNAAFLSCWSELCDRYQDDLIRSLEATFKSPLLPAEIVQTLLNLAEFMEHYDKAFPIDIKTLGNLAQKCHAYAKAMHYKEIEFRMSPSSADTIDSLISINNILQHSEAARGILTCAERYHAVELKVSWYEKLHHWSDALEAYEIKQLEKPVCLDTTLGRMRCLQALGEWQRLHNLCRTVWRKAPDEKFLRHISPFAANAAVNLRNFNHLEKYVARMDDKQDFSRSFYSAVLKVHKNEFKNAKIDITKAIELLDTNLASLVGESYNRAFTSIVKMQQLIELEEVIEYKTCSEEKKIFFRKMWKDRLEGCQQNVDVWQQILSVRSLVIDPKKDIDTWLEFARLCRENGQLHLSLKVINNLLGFNPEEFVTRRDNRPPRLLPKAHPQMAFSCLEHLHAAGYKQQSFNALDQLVKEMSHAGPGQTFTELKSKCYLRLGQWQYELMDNSLGNVFSLSKGYKEPEKEISTNYIEPNNQPHNFQISSEIPREEIIRRVLRYFHESTNCNNQNFKAWHECAVMHWKVVSHYKLQQAQELGHNEKHKREQAMIKNHVVPAINGFFRSIQLQTIGENSRQDVLRLIQLWFDYGKNKEVEMAISQGTISISIDTWLAVIPQLIARIHIEHASIHHSLHNLLCKIGKAHPQALVYPLTVASKSQDEARRRAANSVLSNMQIHSEKLVEQALLVSKELVRVAILWNEQWHNGIEEASRCWFGQNNVEGMFAALMPLHDMMERGPETMREVTFQQQFGRELSEAYQWCLKYQRTRNKEQKKLHLHRAWDVYYAVFRKMDKQQLTDVELSLTEVSPNLLAAKDMELAVPGTYKAGQPLVKIRQFDMNLRVIESKQHPRRLQIWGSDGSMFPFLLKGGEDIRQDRLVMQLFGLVNTLLSLDQETAKTDLSIRTYAVIPLSPNSGLIEWVPDSPTVHAVIKQYRDTRKIMLNIEQRLMVRAAPHYQHLTLIQKVEIFQHALNLTTGQDLCRVLWLNSHNAEAWLDRRTNYTRSLAVMSMVGYILGLGDRHPCNLMLHRYTGKIIHIDFGDCFEVAMQRDKYPEKVPFRLTRMLVNSMEVSGIEGSYRSTCESVMQVLRKNKDSVMAVLEAFVHNPLVNWRLLVTKNKKKDKKKGSQTKGGSDGNNNESKRNPGETVKQNEGVDETSGPEIGNEARRDETGRGSISGALGPNYAQTEELNNQAIEVISRVEDKLNGTDFADELGAQQLNVTQQVQRLIEEATSHENLCQAYIGWCPFW